MILSQRIIMLHGFLTTYKDYQAILKLKMIYLNVYILP